jgi:hypothetical protein
MLSKRRSSLNGFSMKSNVGVSTEQGGDFGLDSLRQQRLRAVSQNLGQRIGKTSWLG